MNKKYKKEDEKWKETGKNEDLTERDQPLGALPVLNNTYATHLILYTKKIFIRLQV